MIYPYDNCNRRTDEMFRMKLNKEHHIGTSPVLKLRPKINMVDQFVLDFMHLGCIGLMGKLISYWMAGATNVDDVCKTTKLSKEAKVEINRRLKMIHLTVTNDFQRKTESLVNYGDLKATELRVISLYTGPLIFNDLLTESAFKHFLLFHIACRILCCEETAVKYNTQAKFYLHRFFLGFLQIYGLQTFLHNILHMADDALKMNCNLMEISAFPFENLIKLLKDDVAASYKPLQQI